MTISFIQGASSTSGGSHTTAQPTTYGANVTTGNLLICCGGWAANSFTSFGVTDNLGDSVPWTINPGLQAQQGSGSPYSIAVAYKVAGLTSGTPPTVTIAPGGGSQNFVLNFVHEYSGVGSLDQIATGTSGNTSGTTATSGAFTTTHANELIFAFPIFDAGTSPSPGTGFTARVSGSSQLSEDDIVSSVQTGATATATNPVTGLWAIVVGTFFTSAGHTSSLTAGASFTGGQSKQIQKLLIG